MDTIKNILKAVLVAIGNIFVGMLDIIAVIVVLCILIINGSYELASIIGLAIPVLLTVIAIKLTVRFFKKKDKDN